MNKLASFALTALVIALLSVLLATVTANSWNASQSNTSAMIAVYKIDLQNEGDK